MDGNQINYRGQLEINDLNSTFGNKYLEFTEQNYLIYGAKIGSSYGNDYLEGTEQNDLIISTRIDGTPGNDTLVGTEQNDQIYGYAGNDILIGNAGDDLLEGGLGNDRLIGGLGNDQLTGGPGRDIFVLNYSGGGIDTITDFTVGVDYLKVKQAGIDNITIIDPLALDSINTEAFDDFLLYDANTSVFDRIDTITDFTVKDDGNGYQPTVIPDPASLGSNNPFRYDANSGALFYRNEQIAWLTPNLSLGQIQPTTTIDVYYDILPTPIFNDI